jgi:hypothetical protein
MMMRMIVMMMKIATRNKGIGRAKARARTGMTDPPLETARLLRKPIMIPESGSVRTQGTC